MKKIKNLLAIGILIGLISCKIDSIDFNANSMVTEDGQISKKLANDSLFEKFDKAEYKMRQDLLKYAGEQVDWERSSKINQDFKNRKFKTFQEFAIAKEKAGYKDFLKRTQTQLYVFKTKDELFSKYPELKKLPMKTFLIFFRENSKYQLANEDFKSHIKKLKEENNNK